MEKPLKPGMKYSLGRAFPDWMAGTDRSDTTAGAAPTREEFVLTTNWVLLPEGLKEFYEALYQQGQNLEVFYNPSVHGFDIKSWSSDQAMIVKLVQSILGKIVPTTENGFDKSTKVMSVREWRSVWNEGKAQADGQADQYSFPRDVARCVVRATWGLPKSWVDKDVAVGNMIPERSLCQIEQSTQAKLVLSCDGCTVYVGASKPEHIEAAKKKLTNIARYCYYVAQQDAPERQIVGVYLCNEGDTSLKAEYRFLSDGNEGTLLRSYILDRFNWPNSEKHYKILFERAAVVSLKSGKDSGIRKTLVSAASQSHVKAEGFNAFKPSNWRYRPKAPEEATVWSSPKVTPTTKIPPKEMPPREAPGEDTLSTDIPPMEMAPQEMPLIDVAPPRRQSPAIEAKIPATATPLQAKTWTEDPFKGLWENCRSTVPQARPKLDQKTQETRPRVFHVTMRQKAGARVNPKLPDIHPDATASIKKSLKTILAPISLYPGFVDFKLDLGRLSFVNIKKSRIQKPENDDEKKHYPLQSVIEELNERHRDRRHIYFTQILTCFGADANHICYLKNDDGTPTWHRPSDGRSSTYEFVCRSSVGGEADFHFVVEINAITMEWKVKEFEPERKSIAVHCTKRAWDFCLTVSTSESLDHACGDFASELVRSLRVLPHSDSIPELEVSYDISCTVEILAVRTRNTACCTSEKVLLNAPSVDDYQRLDVSEVWEMARLSKNLDGRTLRLKFALYQTPLISDVSGSSHPVKWYEASLRSHKISAALDQSRKLELGDEADWKAEDLVDSGSVDKLIEKAAEVVKKLDSVGYWNDNEQGERMQVHAPKKSARKELDIFW
ncbi:hypothetical protein F5Y17DRAFT_400591 [Xylariaceae sp. FL0594]|nr:hypothetical protein F5Y17DRAFT_400591 [Xylariaceae sp. FL0594]